MLGWLDGAPDGPVPVVGHSLGGRLALELVFEAPERVSRAALLDPALAIDPAEAHASAEEERTGRVFASRDEALEDRRAVAPLASEDILEEELAEHLVQVEDGRFRFRYAPSAAVALYGALAEPTRLDRRPAAAARVLLVPGAESLFVTEEHVAGLRGAFGDGLELVTVPGGHMVLWDAFDETAEAVLAFLG